MSVKQTLRLTRKIDQSWQRWRRPEERSVLINAHTSMEYAMMAPVYQRMKRDARIKFYFTAGAKPHLAADIYRDAGADVNLIDVRRASWMRFDVYLAADFLWVRLPRGTSRIQMFHGVAGKYGNTYDSPDRSMREWHRLFFINRRRLQNFIASGAIDADSPAARLIGMPKVDCLVDGSLKREDVLASLGIDPARKTVLYAPTWTPYSSLNAMGEELIERLGAAGYALMVKLHDNSRSPLFVNSGGIDWVARLEPILRTHGGVLVNDSTASPYLVASDVMITDHSSVGFEYLLLDRPLVRIEMPELIAKTNIHQNYVALMAEASITVRTAAETLDAVEQSLAAPESKAASRQSVADELFYQPGTATERAVSEIYRVMELAEKN